MNKRTLATLAIIGLALWRPALADLEIVTINNAVELAPSNIIMPSAMTGMVSYRPCDGDCDKPYERARLTEGTTFTVNGKAVEFEEFRKSFAVIRGAEDSYALLSYDTKTRTVTSLAVAN